MLLKSTFPSSYLELVKWTSAVMKKWVFFGTASYKFMSVKNTPLPQQYIIYSPRSEEQSIPIVPQNAATTPAKNRLKRPSSCSASCTRAGASSSSPVTLLTLVDGVPFRRTPTFSGPLMSLRPARDMSLGRWILVACFSSVKNHNVSGPHLFPSVITRAKKIPLFP